MSEDEAFGFAEKLSEPDGTITSSSIEKVMDNYTENQRNTDEDDEEDFNYTADSLMKNNELMEDEQGNEDLNSDVTDHNNDGNYQPNSSISPPILGPFSMVGRTSSMGENEDLDEDDNLNDISMLSDDKDSPPTSPSRVFYQPSPRPRRRYRKPLNDNEYEDLTEDDDVDSANYASHEEEDESDNSSIDTAGMKHSQTLDSGNFFFCPESENPPSNFDSTHQSMLEAKEKDENTPIGKPPNDILVDDNIQSNLNDADGTSHSLQVVEEQQEGRVGLSLTALPQELTVVPHPIVPNKPGSDNADILTESKEKIDLNISNGVVIEDYIVNIPTVNGESESNTNDPSPNIDASNISSSDIALKPVPCDDSSEVNSDLKTDMLSSTAKSIDNISEVTVNSTDNAIVGLWDKHPVPQNRRNHKVKVYAFGRTSYEKNNSLPKTKLCNNKKSMATGKDANANCKANRTDSTVKLKSGSHNYKKSHNSSSSATESSNGHSVEERNFIVRQNNASKRYIDCHQRSSSGPESKQNAESMNDRDFQDKKIRPQHSKIAKEFTQKDELQFELEAKKSDEIHASLEHIITSPDQRRNTSTETFSKYRNEKKSTKSLHHIENHLHLLRKRVEVCECI